MANAGVAKGSTVEVCSEEPGFHGAWYVATLLDDQLKYSPPPSSTNKKSSNKKATKKEIGCLVKYDTLLKDDSLDEPLTEIVNPSCVRPLPPRNLRRNNVSYAMGEGGGGDDFEVYDVVDAYHREGWWIGVVNKVVVTVAGTRKYVVSFENPPEEVEFGRSQLRLHVDWVDGRWQFPPKKMPEDKLAERNAKRAPESDNDARAGLTTPSKGARTTDADSANAGPQPSSVAKTRSRKTTEKSSEMVVGSVKDSDSSKRNRGSKGNTKVKSSVMENRGSDDVHEDLPLKESETNKITTTPDVDNPTVAPQLSSVTKIRAKKNSERSSEMVGVVKASDPPAGNKGNTKEKASVMEKRKSDAVNHDSPLTEPELNRVTTAPVHKLVERNAKCASESNNDACADLTTSSKGAQTTNVDNTIIAPQLSSIIKSRARKNSERSSETVGVVKASDPLPGSKGNTKDKVSATEKSKSDAVNQDSPLTEPETNKTSTTPDVDNTTVAPQPSSVMKSRTRKNSERSSETVGVVKASDPSLGKKGNTNDKASVMEKSKSDAVNQDSPSMEPEMNKITSTPDADILSVAPQPPSVLKSRAMKNSERSSEMVSVVKASDPSPGCKGNTKAKDSRSDAVHQDSPLMEHETNQTTSETCEAENSQSPRKKRKVKPPKLPAKEPISLQKGGPEITVDLDEPLSQLAGSFSSRPNHNDEPPSQPTVANPDPEPNHHDEQPSQPTVISPGPGPDPDPDPNHHDEPVGTVTDYQQNWPFTKQSPIWATIAALEFYQTPQQRPHFTPLKKIKADHREGLAIAHVVTFGNLVQMLSTLQLTDPVDVINNSLEILADLETHGFEVGAIRGRLNKFLSLKSEASQHTIKLKKIEEEFEKCNGERSVEENEINELEMKIKELQEKLVQKVAMKKVRDEEIVGLQSSMKLASEQISDCELTFKKLISTPL